jgi:hypothetical protein
MVATAIIGSAVAGAGASVAGSMAQASATKKASKGQQDAQKYAADIQQQMYETTRGDLSRYSEIGQFSNNLLLDRVYAQKQPTFQKVDYTPVKMDQATLEQTPGYQFNLAQGLKSVQNSAAARGLGNSGAALKGAASYATGLADSTYQNQFNNATTNAQNVYTANLNNSTNTYNAEVAGQTNEYNRLMGLTSVGEAAAAQTGAYGTQTAGNIGQGAIQTAQAIGNNTIQGGNAQAAGYTGAANALAGGMNNYLQYNALKGLYGTA